MSTTDPHLLKPYIGIPEVTSESLGHLHRNADRRDELCHLQRVPPREAATECFVGDDYHVSRLECGVQRTAAKQSALPAHYRAVRPNHENRSLIRHRCRTAGLVQIPASTFARFVSDGGRVENRTIDHYKIRFLGNVNHI